MNRKATMVFRSVSLTLAVVALPASSQTRESVQAQTLSMGAPQWGRLGLSLPMSREQLKAAQEVAKNHTHLPGPRLPGSDIVTHIEPSVSPTPLLNLSAEPAGAPGDAVLFVATALGLLATGGSTGVVGEPSVGNLGNQVFETGNWYASSSTDGGITFAFVNPYTSFPPSDGGFCCDQVVAADPTNNVIFWLLQYVHDAVRNRDRLVVLRQSDFCYYDFLPEQFGWAGEWFDFPDLSVGNNSVYLTTNGFRIGGGEPFTRTVLMRLPLASLAACQPGLSFDYFVEKQRASFRSAQGLTSTAYWATHNSTSSLRVYSWDEGSTSISFNDVDIMPYNNTQPYRCPGPDGRDWCGNLDDRLGGAALGNGVLTLMWTASQGGSFPYPYVDVARIAVGTLTLIDQPILYNPTLAFTYAAAAPNSRGHLGLSLFGGGAQLLPSHLIGFVDDISPTGALFITATSSQGPNINKWGDYLTVRPHLPSGPTWIGTGYTLQGGGDDGNVVPLYLWYGRRRDTP